MAEKSSSSSSSGIDKAFEGERIITWTCAVLKECLRSQGGRLTGKKEYLVWRQIIHLVTKGWSVISTESLPAWFLQSYLLSQKPRGCNDTGKILFLDAQADDKTTKSDDSARKGAPLAPTELPSDGAHFDHLHSVSSTLWETFFVVACPYQVKSNCLSSFWKNWSGFVNEQ